MFSELWLIRIVISPSGRSWWSLRKMSRQSRDPSTLSADMWLASVSLYFSSCCSWTELYNYTKLSLNDTQPITNIKIHLPTLLQRILWEFEIIAPPVGKCPACKSPGGENRRCWLTLSSLFQFSFDKAHETNVLFHVRDKHTRKKIDSSLSGNRSHSLFTHPHVVPNT